LRTYCDPSAPLTGEGLLLSAGGRYSTPQRIDAARIEYRHGTSNGCDNRGQRSNDFFFAWGAAVGAAIGAIVALAAEYPSTHAESAGAPELADFAAPRALTCAAPDGRSKECSLRSLYLSRRVSLALATVLQIKQKWERRLWHRSTGSVQC
jgi:hypothetical protein